ncbi:MAG: hypothetical protein K2X29_13460 [Candidatus Obscuribacterales bacterium]|nr:hypothetical protein [Candidatus Obscuribacterales bacterium]
MSETLVLSDRFIRPIPWINSPSSIAAIIPDRQSNPAHQRKPATWYETARAELRSLSLLSANWDDEGAAKPMTAILASANGLISYIEKSKFASVDEPTIAPTRNGGVLLEWNHEQFRLDIELASAKEAKFACLDRSTRKQCKGTLFLGQSVSDEFSKCLEHFLK